MPADGIQLIDVPRNLGVNGNTPGRVIRIAMREVLDAQAPDWHTLPPSAVTKHYMYSPLDPKHFYVYPPATGTASVEIIYSATPAKLAQLANTISIDDIYANVLVDYILYRAYSKDSEYVANPARASAHQGAYVGALTGKTQSEVVVNPNTSAPASPNA